MYNPNMYVNRWRSPLKDLTRTARPSLSEGVPSRYVVIAHDETAQEMMDNLPISWSVFVRRVSLGLWSWDDVTRGDCAHRPLAAFSTLLPPCCHLPSCIPSRTALQPQHLTLGLVFLAFGLRQYTQTVTSRCAFPALIVS